MTRQHKRSSEPGQYAGVNAIDPDVDVFPLGEVSFHELLTLFLPLLGQSSYRGRRETGLRAEKLLQDRDEVPAGEPVQIKQGQDLCDLQRAAHVGRQDHALEPSTVAGLVEASVIDPWGLCLH